MSKFKLIIVGSMAGAVLFASGYMLLSYRSAESDLTQQYVQLNSNKESKNAGDKKIKFLTERDSESGLLTFADQGSRNDAISNLGSGSSDTDFSSEGDSTDNKETSNNSNSDNNSSSQNSSDSNSSSTDNQNNQDNNNDNSNSNNNQDNNNNNNNDNNQTTQDNNQNSNQNNNQNNNNNNNNNQNNNNNSNQNNNNNQDNKTVQPTTSANDVQSLAKTLATLYVTKYGDSPYSAPSFDITINGQTLNARPDCSGSVSVLLYLLGKTSSYKKDNSSGYYAHGFEGATNITGSVHTWGQLAAGDVVAKNGHVMIIVKTDGTNAYVAGFGSNKNIKAISQNGHQSNPYSGPIGSQYRVWRK